MRMQLGAAVCVIHVWVGAGGAGTRAQASYGVGLGFNIRTSSHTAEHWFAYSVYCCLLHHGLCMYAMCDLLVYSLCHGK